MGYRGSIDMGVSEKEKQMLQQATDMIKAEIDWGVMVSIYKEQNWSVVRAHCKNRDHSVEMRAWAKANCGPHDNHNNHWMFAQEKDAFVFTLRWL